MRPTSRHRGRPVRGPWPRVSPIGLTALFAIGVLATAGAVAITLDSAPSEHRATAALLHGLIVAVPVALGCAALARRPDDRFALLLVVAGLLWSTTALAESGDAVLYSLGRLFAWCSEIMVLVLLLAFPSGRLRTSHERRLVGAAAALIVLGFMSTALFVSHYPTPAAYTSCDDCPGNAFNIVSWDGIDLVLKPAREVLSVLIYCLAVAVLVRRRRRAGRLLAFALAPVIVVAAFRAAGLAVYFVARRVDAPA